MAIYPDKEILDQITQLSRCGRALDAWNLVSAMDPPEEWSSPLARSAAARLMEQLGAHKRALRLFWKDWRASEKSPDLMLDVFWHVLEKRGAYLAWQWLRRHEPARSFAAKARSDHAGAMAMVLTAMRDFDAADAALRLGEQLVPGDRWFKVLRADWLRHQDLRKQALEIARQAEAEHPEYISAVHIHAELLVEQEQDDTAMEVLRQGRERLQSFKLEAMTGQLLLEQGRLDQAWESLDRCERLLPLIETAQRDWLHGRRCDIASARADRDEALKQASQVQESSFYKRVAEKLSAAVPAPRRVLLPVPFVRQHHVTCAPASMTSLARFWRMEADHLEMAEEICHDGTPNYRQRQWAETHGWAAREFTVTLESARRLLDAGIPFLLSTVYPGGAHAQVVMGQDDLRGVLFIRDPGNRRTSEFLAAEALEQQAPYGPRGLAMVPLDLAATLAAIDLPDAEPHDLFHEVSIRLQQHDRAGALGAIEKLRADYPVHRLRWHAECAIAEYDQDLSAQLAALEELLRLYPGVENWQTRRLDLIACLRGYEAYMAALREVCASEQTHPILWVKLARELVFNTPDQPESRRWLRRVHRARVDAMAIVTEAGLLWENRCQEDAAALYRLAACLEPHQEGMWSSWFRAARWTRQAETALHMLRRRFEQMGTTSAAPALTLCHALEQLDRSHEALAVLEESLRLRPDDADHALHAASEMLLRNRPGRAREILDGIQGSARAAAWHRVRARLAKHEGDVEAQLHHWRAVIEDQPLDAGAHRAFARLLEFQEGQAASLSWLRGRCAQHPFDRELHLVMLTWAEAVGLDEREAAVREIIRIDPKDPWAHRELADVLCARRCFAEAHAVLDYAASIQGSHPALHNIRSLVLEGEGKMEEALVERRRSLSLDVDNTSALTALLRLSRGPEQRSETIRFIQSELRRQITCGDAVLTFAEQARPYMDDTDLEAFLAEARASRPDLWQPTVQLAEHWRDTGRVEEALALLSELTDKFPLMPRVWMEAALCHEAKGDRPAAIAAAEKAREINPSWSWGMRCLSEFKRKAGDLQGARAVLEETLRHNPDDAVSHAWLAEVLWFQGEKKGAMERLTFSLRLDPGYGWPWEKLHEWGQLLGQPDAARRAAAGLLRERPAEARSWINQARLLDGPHEFAEKIAALDKAISLSPQAIPPIDMKATALALAGRFEEALAVCRNRPATDTGLRVREAWILWLRGAQEDALRVMHEALAEDPANLRGWEHLAEWHEQRGELEQAEAACRQISRLEPMQAMPMGYLGSLLEAQEKPEEASAAYQRAIELDPGYGFAVERLLNLSLSRQDGALADSLLKDLTPHYPALYLDSWRFVFLSRRGESAQALEMLEQMLQDPHDDDSCFNRVLSEIGSSGRKLRRLIFVLTLRLLRQGCIQPYAGAFYVELCKAAGKLPDLRVMNLLPPDQESGSRAWKLWIYWIGDRWQERHTYINGLFCFSERLQWRAVMTRYGQVFHQQADLYGAVSYTLNQMDRNRELIRWFDDWQSRPQDMMPYMFNNLVLALQETGDAASARQVAQAGMDHPEHSPIKMRCHIWIALDHALEGRRDEALSCLSSVNPHVLDDYTVHLYGLVETVLDYQPGGDVPPFDATVRARLSKLMALHRFNPVMRAAIRRCCLLASQRLDSFLPRFWCFGKENEIVWWLFVLFFAARPIVSKILN